MQKMYPCWAKGRCHHVTAAAEKRGVKYIYIPFQITCHFDSFRYISFIMPLDIYSYLDT
jgi:hypothetical protein